MIANLGFASAQVRWQFAAGGTVVGKPTVVDETIYIAGGKTLHALSLDGEELWRRDLPGPVAARVRVEQAVIYVHSSAGLHALNQQGEPIWTHANQDLGPLVDGRTWGWGHKILADPWGWYRSAPLIADETVYFGSSDGVHAVSKETGEVRWQVPIGPVTADLLAFRDMILVASWNDSLYGLDAKTGKPRWRFRARTHSSKGVDWVGYLGFHLTPVLEGDRLYAGTRGTYFYAVDANDGSEVWSSKVGSSWIGSPAVLGPKSVYYGLSDGAAVQGYLKASGRQTAFFKTGSLVFAQPGLHDQQLIVGTLSGHLFGVDTVTGQGAQLLHLGSEQVRYREFFEPANVPPELTRHQATQWSVNRMLTEANSILNLTIVEDIAYIGTGSGRLYAVDL